MTVGRDGFDEGRAIAHVSYTHDALIDMIMAEPERSQRSLAAEFGYTEGWISRIIASDVFQVRLAERKAQLVDPEIARTMNERLEAMAQQSLEIVERKLEQTKNPLYALQALGLASRALGYGMRER
jgi:hypothetical protein